MARDIKYIRLLIKQTNKYINNQTKPLFVDQIARLEAQEKALAKKPKHKPKKNNN
jgi:hypothetical protein